MGCLASAQTSWANGWGRASPSLLFPGPQPLTPWHRW